MKSLTDRLHFYESPHSLARYAFESSRTIPTGPPVTSVSSSVTDEAHRPFARFARRCRRPGLRMAGLDLAPVGDNEGPKMTDSQHELKALLVRAADTEAKRQAALTRGDRYQASMLEREMQRLWARHYELENAT